MTTPLERVLAQVRRTGPVPFDRAIDEALYGEGGFYTSGGSAGRRGDFVTSPELGPLFGVCLARALDEAWRDLDQPAAFVVVEGGAGAGTLCRQVLAAAPACAPALRWLLVERSDALRARAAGVVPVEPPTSVLGPSSRDDGTGAPVAVAGAGPLVTALADLPPGPVVGVVVANELLDNLAPVLAERRAEGWAEVRVGDAAGRLGEVVVPALPDLAAAAQRLAPDAPPGGRIPVQRQARRWLQRALGLLEAGRVMVVDYADTTPSMAQRPMTEWLRSYRGHQRGGDPLDDFGAQDVTCEVAQDQLAAVRPIDVDRSQADWLVAHGLDDLVADARRVWHERAAIGDLDAMKARSRVHEADALCDPAGLGAFRVWEWHVR